MLQFDRVITSGKNDFLLLMTHFCGHYRSSQKSWLSNLKIEEKFKTNLLQKTKFYQEPIYNAFEYSTIMVIIF